MIGFPVDRISRKVGDTEIRPIGPGDEDFEPLIGMMLNAYASYIDPMPSPAEEAPRMRAILEDVPSIYWAGGYRNEKLAGAMRLHDMEMRVRGANVFTGGIGGVSVALDHKRRGVARDLILGFLALYRERGAAFAVLHPFRPDFYRNFGFGYGTKMDRYSFALETLPSDGARDRVRPLAGADIGAVVGCYGRMQAVTNGLLSKDEGLLKRSLTDTSLRIFGYEEGGVVRGYVSFKIEQAPEGVANRNQITVSDLVYESPAALAGLLSFLRSQRDQFVRVTLATQEPAFFLASSDPRDGSDRVLAPPGYHSVNGQALGVMYRVLGLDALLEALRSVRFGSLESVVRFALTDGVFPENGGAQTFRFSSGSMERAPEATVPEVEVSLEIGDFSSLVMGSVTLRSLVLFGRASISDPARLDELDRAFATSPPQCMTRF